MNQRGLLHVVDDDPGTCARTAGILAGGGFDTATSTVADCVSSLTAHCPDALFLAIRSDHADEHDALARLVMATFRDLPVVVMIAADCPERAAPLLDAGAADYVMLPLVADDLLPSVARRTLARGAARLDLHATDDHRDLEVLRRDQQAGFQVQRALMPESPLVLGDLQFAHRLQPSLILSGDFVDYFMLPDGRCLFTMADVSGHGASSAFVTVLLKGLTARLQREAPADDSVSSMLEWLNHELLAADLHQHSTCFLGIIDADLRTLHYANAGHFPAAILSSGEGVTALPARGLPLGLDARARYEAHATELPRQFAVTLFSDGVFEIMAEVSMADRERMLLALVESTHGDIGAIALELGLEHVRDMPDDIAVLAIQGHRS